MNGLNLIAVIFTTLIAFTQALPAAILEDFYKRDLLSDKRELSVSEKFVTNRTVDTDNVTGIIYTSGPRTNTTNSSSLVVFPYAVNASNVTLPQLTNISTYFNTSSVSSEITSLVITASNDSLESAGFYFGIAYPNETVVVAENATLGLIVANSSEAFGRGTLVVDATGNIFSAISYPTSPIGFINKKHEIIFSYAPSLPTILSPQSPLYTANNFTHFNTSLVTSNISSAVPIYSFNSSSSSSTSSSLLADVLGNTTTTSNTTSPAAVVIEVANTSMANSYVAPASWKNQKVIIFASNGTSFIDQSALTSNNTIGAGYLSAKKASILASFAISAGLSTYQGLLSAFP